MAEHRRYTEFEGRILLHNDVVGFISYKQDRPGQQQQSVDGMAAGGDTALPPPPADLPRVPYPLAATTSNTTFSLPNSDLSKDPTLNLPNPSLSTIELGYEIKSLPNAARLNALRLFLVIIAAITEVAPQDAYDSLNEYSFIDPDSPLRIIMTLDVRNTIRGHDLNYMMAQMAVTAVLRKQFLEMEGVWWDVQHGTGPTERVRLGNCVMKLEQTPGVGGLPAGVSVARRGR